MSHEFSRRLAVAVAVVVMAAGLATQVAYARPASVHLIGRVTDTAGHAIAGALVVAEPASRSTHDWVTARTAADGSFDIVGSAGSYRVAATEPDHFGTYYSASIPPRDATIITLAPGARRSGIYFRLTPKTIVDASSRLETVAVSTLSRAQSKYLPRLGGSQATWFDGGSILTRNLDVPVGSVSATPSSSGGGYTPEFDANSRYAFESGWIRDLASNNVTDFPGVPKSASDSWSHWGYSPTSACDEEWACRTATWYGRLRRIKGRYIRQGYNGIVALNLRTWQTELFDFGSTSVRMQPGAVNQGRACVEIVSARSGRMIRTLDLVGHRVLPGVIGPIGRASGGYAGCAMPYAGRVAYLDGAAGVVKLVDASGANPAVVSSRPAPGSVYQMIGDGHRVMWAQQLTRPGDPIGTAPTVRIAIRALDLAGSAETTVAVLDDVYNVADAPSYDVSGDRFVWAVPWSPVNIADYWTLPGASEIRTALASDIAGSQRADQQTFAYSNPTAPLLVDGYVLWLDNAGHPAYTSGKRDLWARSTAGGSASVIATGLTEMDVWKPVALSGSRVAWAKNEGWGVRDNYQRVSVHVTDVASHDTTTVATDVVVAGVGTPYPGWRPGEPWEMVGSGDWVYYKDSHPAPRGKKGRYTIVGYNASTGATVTVAAGTSNWLIGLTGAGGGRVLYLDAANRGWMFDPATRTRRAIPASATFGSRVYAEADYPSLIGFGPVVKPGAWWYPSDFGTGPIVLSSLDSGTGKVIDPYANEPTGFDGYPGSEVLGLSGRLALLSARVCDTETRTYYDFGLKLGPGSLPYYEPGGSDLILTGGAIRGTSVAFSTTHWGWSSAGNQEAVYLADFGGMSVTAK